MRTKIELSQWNRKEQYAFFSQFTEPFFGLTVQVDCTIAYQSAKEQGHSFFLTYLHDALKAANEVEAFRYRIVDKEVYLYDEVHASPTINRPNGTFGFAYMNYYSDATVFFAKAKEEIDRVQQSSDFFPASKGENVLHISAVPWLDFTSMSHARHYDFPDSCPKISFGKVMDEGGRKRMAVSIHGHHALMDGAHVGEFVDRFQQLLNEN
ncbi:chloramphenicol acetyltransferase [Myroides marinus]|uniref:Chloramphenicol acetyltransferase n=1 Tax=Myroides marinus TaxID=703342 RepID=A0A164A0R8_9FLAO|nr:chloramphenicol acetyltransferase [Myroides marinus]KUF44394.1 chloramphenicol acetyltransferase [Myroides marinus]KZE82793.1 chloramphenicol acetyltransferase [Myroides marinus]